MFKKLFSKIRNWWFYHRHGFTQVQIRDLVNHTKLQELLERKDCSYNEYLRKYFNADSKR